MILPLELIDDAATFAATKSAAVNVKSPVEEPVAVVVATTNLSALSSQPINPLLPV